MGLFSSQPDMMKEAKRIREDLHRRVRVVKEKYIEQFGRISPELKKSIYRATATQLADLMDQGRVTSEQIILGFIEKCSKEGVDNNYIIDEMFEEALIQARKVDTERAKNIGKRSWKIGQNPKECFPPFFGVPISVKESIYIKGRQVHAGFVSKINPIMEQDLLYIRLILDMGFIPFVRTNICQGAKTVETCNNMFGYAKNPWNLQRTVGGSSGGEAGLLASGCSPIGIGTDIGGSLRNPADWNGLYTLMANYRVTRVGNGFYGKFAGGITVKSVVGILSKGTLDQITILQYMCNQQNYHHIPRKFLDPYLNIKAFNTDYMKAKHKLRIGTFSELKTLKASLTHQRAVRECNDILRNNGHQIVPIELPDFEELYWFMFKVVVGGAGTWIIDEMRNNQPLTKEYKLGALATKIPWFIRAFLLFFLKKITPRFAKILECSRPLTVKQHVTLIYEAQVELSKKIYATFAQKQIDVLITPGFAFPAPRSGTVGELQYGFSFTVGWNVLHYPAASVPVTTVREGQTIYNDGYNDIVQRNIQKHSLDGSEGLPVGVQVISTPYKQETILYIMKQLEEKLNFREKHPYPV